MVCSDPLAAPTFAAVALEPIKKLAVPELAVLRLQHPVVFVREPTAGARRRRAPWACCNAPWITSVGVCRCWVFLGRRVEGKHDAPASGQDADAFIARIGVACERGASSVEDECSSTDLGRRAWAIDQHAPWAKDSAPESACDLSAAPKPSGSVWLRLAPGQGQKTRPCLVRRWV